MYGIILRPTWQCILPAGPWARLPLGLCSWHSWQQFVCFLMVFAFEVAILMAGNHWRWALGIGPLVACLVLLPCLLWLPESPQMLGLICFWQAKSWRKKRWICDWNKSLYVHIYVIYVAIPGYQVQVIEFRLFLARLQEPTCFSQWEPRYLLLPLASKKAAFP